MSLEIGTTVSGEIIDISHEGVIVTLPEEETGLVPACESLPSETLRARFWIGERVAVKLISQANDGRFLLSIVLPEEGEEKDAFDREFHRLNHVLSNRSAKRTLVQAQHERPVEERIEEWIRHIDKGILLVRRHRGDRLNEEFYDDMNDGGLHANRDGHHRERTV